MALVLSNGGLQQLQGQVPLTALVQEFVNHGGQQYKVYVMGDQVSDDTNLWVALPAYLHMRLSCQISGDRCSGKQKMFGMKICVGLVLLKHAEDQPNAD